MKMHHRWTLERVMNIAHHIRRETAERLNCRPGEILWGECLRMAWECVFTGCGRNMINRINSDKGYSTKSSAWRADRKLVGHEIEERKFGYHASIRWCDLECSGWTSDGWLDVIVLVREDMLSVYKDNDGWHWSVEWWLEDIQLPIIDVPSEYFPDGMNTKHVSLREFVCWNGPRTKDGLPCLNPRYAA